MVSLIKMVENLLTVLILLRSSNSKTSRGLILLIDYEGDHFYELFKGLVQVSLALYGFSKYKCLWHFMGLVSTSVSGNVRV